MNANMTKRILSLVLAFAMVLSLAAPAAATGSNNGIRFTKVNAPSSLEVIGNTTAAEAAAPEHADEDIVRVSIVLEQPSTLHKGFSTMNVAANTKAMDYRAELKAAQQDLTVRIERAIGKKLDVVWNLTLAANLISANVAYGSIAAIEAVPGVQSVVLENVYEPAVVADSVVEEADPQQITSTIMTGTVNVWQSGYTGAGSRVAVIDTGIDTDHQSFSAKGLEYSLALNAEAKGMSLEEYMDSLDLLDLEEINSKLDQLNVQGLRADRVYYSTKIPFGYNYIDRNYRVTHDYDEQGEHGSHVEGIAAANGYIPQRDGSFAEALELTNVKGQAPDAQIISMKVFGENGGAYDSDYMAAIEDAIILGADSVNLSLGSGSSGFSFNFTYAELLASLQNTDTVVTISAGNSYAWDYAAKHDLYVEDVRFSTNGSPGSYSNSLGVASVDSTYFNDDGTYTAPEYYEMSDFSSWGIPESLELKPEITAPGGNIYSVNGLPAGGKSYETMSGTSMAAPQMAGIAAVMAQYIRENGLVEKTGLSVRQLSQSLLMSTAQALKEESNDYWYSVLKQGSGLARPDLATTAQTYILMDSSATAYAADGKVKAELGDDPAKNGVYSVSFTINNFGSEDTLFSLSTELFTQYTNGTYLYPETSALAADVTYLVDGVLFNPVAVELDCDLNGDGVTDSADAKVILEYCVNGGEIAAAADMDANGTIDAYDAHLILAALESGKFTVAAGSSVTVTVEANLTEDQKATLNQKYPAGAYIEGFIFAKGDVEHSIPVLGFYGNWSDPTMFGATYTETLYGNTRKPYFGDAETNNLVVNRGGELSLQVGNPYFLEDTFPTGKAAIRSTDILDSYRLVLLRNAAAVMLSVMGENGNEVYNSGVSNLKHGAYYYVNGSEWRNTSADYALGLTAAELGLAENEHFTVSVIAIPEYYTLGNKMNADAVHAIVASGVLGSGAILETELVVDDTAPEIVAINHDNDTNTLTVTVKDNQYPAALRIVDANGTAHATVGIPSTGEAGSEQVVTMSLAGIAAGDPCYITVGDYATNEAVYEAYLGLSAPGAGGGSGGGNVGGGSGNFYGYANMTANGWIRADVASGAYSTMAKSTAAVEAAEYVDGYVFFVTSDGIAYVAPHGNWNDMTALADLSAYGVEDMAFNYTDNTMYVLGAGNTIYTMNLGSAALTEAFTVSVNNTSNAACNWLRGLAIDGEGNFYVSCDGGSGYEFAAKMFKFTTDMVVDGAITDLAPMGTGYVGGYTDKGQTLAWDHETGKVYYYSRGRYDIDTFGTVNTTGYSIGGVSGILTVPKLGLSAIYFPGLNANVIEFVDEAESFTANIEEMKMLVGSSATVTTNLAPWTLRDKNITWTSSDESVVTVNNGTINAIGKGEAVVTATTNAAPNLTISIDITVSGTPELDLFAMLYDVDGTQTWVTFNTSAPEAWEAVALNQGTESYGAVNLNDVIYVHDGYTLYAMNPDTFEKETISGIGSSYTWMDAAAAFDRIVAPCYYGEGVAIIDPVTRSVFDFDLTDILAGDLLVTMAYAGENDGIHTFYSVAESGNVYGISITVSDDTDGDGEPDYDLSAKRLCAGSVELPGASEVGGSSTASSVFDPESGMLAIAAYAEGDSTGYVYAMEPNGGAALVMGNIGDAVWPFYSLYAYTAPTDLTLRCRTNELFLYKNDQAKISASVSPVGFTGGLTFTSADESVAVVDANGIVTAIAPGSTTITVATVDTDANGNVISKVIPVEVEDIISIDLTIEAKLDFDDEGSKWVTINTADLNNPVIGATDHAYLAAGGVHNGAIYGNDGKYYIDWNYWAVVSNLYMIEPEYDYDITPGGIIGYQNMPTDMTTMPAMEITDAEGNVYIAGDMPIYMDVSEQLIMWSVATSDEIADISGWNLSGEFDGTPGALAYLGTTEQLDDNGEIHTAWSYAVLTNAGALYTINIIAYVNAGEIDYSAFINFVDYIGLEFEYPEPMQMILVDDGENFGFLLGYTSNVAELYYVDLSGDEIVSGKIGNIPGTNTFAAMYFADELNVAPEAPEAFIAEGEKLMTAAKVGPDRTVTVESKLTNDRLSFADGSLASVKAEYETKTYVNDIKVELREEIDTVSGMVTITYDPTVIDIVTCNSSMLTAVKYEYGKVTLAYAKGSAVTAGDVLASLSFAGLTTYVNTTITIETVQRNAEGVLTGEVFELPIVFEMAGHNYVETERVDATCTEDGYVVYTCQYCGDSYTEVLEAIGHNYVDDTCENCGDVLATVIATGWSGYTTWAMMSDGTLIFSPTEEHLDGQCNLKNYWKVNGVLTLPWGAYAEMITKVVIEDGIHDIGQMAFYELPNLTEVVLGADIVEIRNYAFKNCQNLTTINLENVDFIREGAFYGCSSLTGVQFMDGVVIEDWAFTRSPYASMNP